MLVTAHGAVGFSGTCFSLKRSVPYQTEEVQDAETATLKVEAVKLVPHSGRTLCRKL